MSTASIRVDAALVDDAKAVGAIMSRSAAQQLSHWAKLGRELEAASGVSQSLIQRVLAKDPAASYDDLSADEQAAVRVAWAELAEERRARLNFAEEFAQSGSTYTTADEHGTITRHSPHTSE